MKQLIKMINSEDKKNPLTDDDLAKALGIARSEVLRLRNALDISNSRKRLQTALEKALEDLLKKQSGLSERAITQKINDLGFDVSRHTVVNLLKNIPAYNEGDNSPSVRSLPASPNSSTSLEETAFDNIAGNTGSLKPQVELAKAAILYPPKGLHTLIIGDTGVGKSEFAHCMYKFAIESGAKKQNSPFIVFNCADYAETPQLLLSQLFGYVKGAFTGAVNDKEGLVEKANNGILFLDEIHRLPPEGQEILYYLMDKGKFRKLGESSHFRNISIMLIAATTESIESSLLLPFRRRIPMLIELPSLEQRPLEERLQVIIAFMRKEANRLNLTIQINYNVTAALLLYSCPGNIGQLYSDIQVACAKAFLEHMATKESVLQIEIGNLRPQVLRGLLDLGSNRQALEKILTGDLKISPNYQVSSDLLETVYLYPTDIYQEIKSSYIKMERQGIENSIINQIVREELELKLQEFIKHTQQRNNKITRQDLEKIVEKKIIDAVEHMLSLAKQKIPDIDGSLLYCLATHLSSFCERQNTPEQSLATFSAQTLCTENPVEYNLAEQMTKIANYYLGICLPESETAFIAMYLKAYSKKSSLEEPHVGIIVLSHGHVAEGMAQVANRLLHVSHARAVEMPLEESCELALQRAIDIAKKADQGKGVLLLADMGSLVSFGKLITHQTGISTRTIARTHMQMLLEATRKALLPNMTLDELANSLQTDFGNCNEDIISDDHKISSLPQAIVTICLTGIGTAKWLAEKIKKNLNEKLGSIKIISIGALVEKDVQQRLRELQGSYQLLAIVGTIGPVIPEIPYISSTEIISSTGLEKLKKIIEIAVISTRNSKRQNLPLTYFFCPKLIFLQQSFSTKQEALNFLSTQLVESGCIQKNYIRSIYEREDMAQSVFKDIALPHGNPEYIIKPSIAAMTLTKPLMWYPGYYVTTIFMLALKQYQKSEFKKLYFLLNDEATLQTIKASSDIETFMACITQK